MKMGINEMKPKRAFNQLGKALLCAGLIALLSILPQQADASGSVRSMSGHGVSDFASALYRNNYVDMQVKVRGRMLKIKRRWQDDHWTLLPDIGDLTFEYEQVYVEAKNATIGVTGGSSTGGSATVFTGTDPQTVDGELKTIKRGDFEYKKVEGGTDGNIIFRFTPDDKKSTQGFTNRKTITKTAEGYIWSDGAGNKIVYDTAGKIQYIEDANSNKITMVRDTQGRIEGIIDPADEQVITIRYIADSDKIEKVTDYTGRFIEYVWDGDNIDKFKDVMGEYTDYGYTHYDIRGGIDVLSTEKNPVGQIITINYNYNSGGFKCIPDEKNVNPENRTVRSADGQYIDSASSYSSAASSYYSSSNGCKYRVMIPKSITMHGITLPGDAAPNKTYDYFYDSVNELYYHKTIHADGMVEENAVNLNGETVAKYINNLRVMKATKDGNKTIIEDEQGLKNIKEYDQWKRVTKITYPDNSTKTWKYNSMGKKLEEVNEEGIITKYEYDTQGNLHKRFDAFGTSEQHTIEWCAQLTDIEDCNTLKAANCTGSPSNRCSLVKYHGGVIDSIVIEDAIKVTIYDDKDNVARTVDAEGNTTQYQDFDALGNAKKLIDAAEYEWFSTYDNEGKNLTSSTPSGYAVTYAYTKSGQLETVTDSMPNQGQNSFDVKYYYNDKGLVYKVEDSYGNFTETRYDSRGRVIELKDAEGQTKKTSFDVFGRRSEIQDGEGNKVKYYYFNNGNGPYKMLDFIEYPTFKVHFKYDKKANLVKVFNEIEEGKKRLIADIKCNKLGQRVSLTDANGKETKYIYNKHGQVIKNIDADQNETSYIYDYTGNILSVEDPELSKTQYRYDMEGKKIKETLPLLGEYSYGYNNMGMLETSVDPKGNKSIYVYDQDGNLDLHKKFAADDLQNPENEVDFDYYINGQLQYYGDDLITSQFIYDDKGMLIKEVVDFGQFTKDYGYTYYKNGSKKSYTDAEGITYNYEYNGLGKLRNLKIPMVGTYSISDYQNILPKKELYPGGARRDIEYYSKLEIKNIKVTDPAQKILMDYQYAYDKAGNIDTKTTEHGLYDYGYDNLYRLTNVVNPNTDTETYTYDTIGNRKTTQESIEEWLYNANHELQSRPQYGYHYDANGSIDKITKDSQDIHLIYNEANRLTEVKNHASQTVAKYQYDPLGRRISKDVVGTKTYFMYTDRGLIAEYTQTGELIRGYGYKPYGRWTTDPLYQKINGKYYFYQNDHLGTPQKLTGTNGAIVWDAKYDSFGKINIQLSEIDNPLRFPGQYHDMETGLYYNYHRYYDSSAGRYLSSDPIGVLMDYSSPIYRVASTYMEYHSVFNARKPINHVYSYARGNPANYWDEFGLLQYRYVWCTPEGCDEPSFMCKKLTDYACDKGNKYCCHVERDECMFGSAGDTKKMAQCQIDWSKCTLGV